MDVFNSICQDDVLCFWATRYDSMNDPTDYIYSKQKVEKQLKSYYKNCKWENEDAYPYILSFSKKEDDFYMWRMYSANISFEIDYEEIRKWVSDNNLRNDKVDFLVLGECRYPQDDDNIIDKFKEIRNELNPCNDEHVNAQEAFVFIKRFEFKDENEIRLCAFDYDGSIFYEKNDKYVICDLEIPKNVKVKCVKDNDIILYKEFRIPKTALTGIFINCNTNEEFEKIKSHIRVVLLSKRYDITKIHIRKTNTGNRINNL